MDDGGTLFLFVFFFPLVIYCTKCTSDLYSPRNDPDPENDPQPWNDPQIDPEMIPISLHVDLEVIPN